MTAKRFGFRQRGPFVSLWGPGYAAAGIVRTAHVWLDWSPTPRLAVAVRIPRRPYYLRVGVGCGAWGVSWPRVYVA